MLDTAFFVLWGVGMASYLRLKFVVKEKEEGLYNRYFGNRSSEKSDASPSRFAWYALKINCWDEGLDPKVLFWLRVHCGATYIFIGYTLLILVYFAALVVGELLSNG